MASKQAMKVRWDPKEKLKVDTKQSLSQALKPNICLNLQEQFNIYRDFNVQLWLCYMDREAASKMYSYQFRTITQATDKLDLIYKLPSEQNIKKNFGDYSNLQSENWMVEIRIETPSRYNREPVSMFTTQFSWKNIKKASKVVERPLPDITLVKNNTSDQETRYSDEDEQLDLGAYPEMSFGDFNPEIFNIENQPSQQYHNQYNETVYNTGCKIMYFPSSDTRPTQEEGYNMLFAENQNLREQIDTLTHKSECLLQERKKIKIETEEKFVNVLGSIFGPNVVFTGEETQEVLEGKLIACVDEKIKGVLSRVFEDMTEQ